MRLMDDAIAGVHVCTGRFGVVGWRRQETGRHAAVEAAFDYCCSAHDPVLVYLLVFALDPHLETAICDAAQERARIGGQVVRAISVHETL